MTLKVQNQSISPTLKSIRYKILDVLQRNDNDL